MTPTRVLPLTGCTPAGIPTSPDPTAEAPLTCLKCSSLLQGFSCDHCDGTGRVCYSQEGYRTEYDDCHWCEGMGEYFECTECGARWSADEMHGQALETLREAWKLMVAA